MAFEVVSPPFAEELIAEIAPRTAQLGAKTRFAYAVLHKAQPGQVRGFDRFHIDTPLRVEELGKVEIRRPGGAVTQADFTGISLEALPVSQGEIAVVEADDAGFTIAFPRIIEGDTVLEIEFENAVLRFGTIFSGRAQDSQSGSEVGQEVVSGNAADLRESGFDDGDLQPVGVPKTGNLSVAVPIAHNLLANVRAVPPIFSPNGDGVNERTLLSYDITNLASPVPVRIAIFDLAGRLVRNLYAEKDISGRYERAWDGRDSSGDLVPPGHYLFSVELEAATGSEKEIGIINIVY